MIIRTTTAISSERKMKKTKNSDVEKIDFNSRMHRTSPICNYYTFLESDIMADVGGTSDGVERKQSQQRPAFGYLVPRRPQKNHTNTTNCPTFLDLKKCPRR